MKSSKIYIIAAICLIAGLIICIIGASMCGFDFARMKGSTQFNEQTYTSTGSITEISTDVSNAKIIVKKSHDDRIHLSYQENNKNTYSVTESDGVLSLVFRDDSEWYDYIMNIEFNQNIVTVEVPANYSGKLDLTTSNAKIELSEITAAEVSLKNSNGSIDLGDITVSSINADTSNAKISLSSVSSDGEIILRSSNAAAELEKVSTMDGISVKTSNAKITCEDISADSLSFTSSNAKIEMENVFVKKELSADTSYGSIAVDNIDAESIILKTSNASIRGSVCGKMTDYTIESKTSNADNNLPETMSGGNKTLKVKTSNEKINIAFDN